MSRRPAPDPLPDIVRDELGRMVCTHGEPRGSEACGLCRAAARTVIEGENPYVRPDYSRPSAPMPDYLRTLLADIKAGRRTTTPLQDALADWDGK